MSVTDWFRRLFSPSSSPNVQGAEDEAILHEEYGGEAAEPAPGGIAGGASGLAAFEDAEAAEGAMEATDPPSDPAP